MVNVGSVLESWVFPAVCVLCGAAPNSRRVEANAVDLCEKCRDDLPSNGPACAQCAEPLYGIADQSLCGVCLRKRPAQRRQDGAFCAFRYGYPVDHLIRALKFHGKLAYARVLGECLAQELRRTRSSPWPELIVPVPLGTKRFRERGFNQALEIALILEQRLGVSLRPDVVARTRETLEQTGLDGKARRKNLRRAFSVAEKLREKHVAIVDDVITTGSTMNELARTLRRAGAARVEAWAVARTSSR